MMRELKEKKKKVFSLSLFRILCVVCCDEESRKIFIQRRKTLELAKISRKLVVIFTKQDDDGQRCRQLPKITMDKF